jgi:hypothetical protein
MPDMLVQMLMKVVCTSRTYQVHQVFSTAATSIWSAAPSSDTANKQLLCYALSCSNCSHLSCSCYTYDFGLAHVHAGQAWKHVNY